MNKKPLEIEYKFLIEYPDTAFLSKLPGYRCVNMTQMYLTLPESFGSESGRCRIREAEENGEIKYIKTFKQALSDLTRIEIESEISAEEFNKLAAYQTPDCSPIIKTRHIFPFESFICEVDVFPFWDDRAFLEIEVTSEDITPPIPPFIRIIKDVSTDKRYRNSALARNVVFEAFN